MKHRKNIKRKKSMAAISRRSMAYQQHRRKRNGAMAKAKAINVAAIAGNIMAA
jgi:hypothetical protein